MSGQIIDGKAFAAELKAEIAQKTADLIKQYGIQPGIAVIVLGNDPASEVYVRNKGVQAQEVGFLSRTIALDHNTTQAQLLAEIQKLNHDPHIHAILVQLPLPDHIDKTCVLAAIVPSKDVDGFHPLNVGKLWLGEETIVPCTPQGCDMLLTSVMGEDLSGKRAVIVGVSNIVGKPMGALLLKRRATVSFCNSRTQNLAQMLGQADIVVVAAGKPHLINGDMLKEGAVVLDVGINRIEENGKNRLVGDVDTQSALKKVKAITPVPGGVGPMTIACLLNNTLQLAKAHILRKEDL